MECNHISNQSQLRFSNLRLMPSIGFWINNWVVLYLKGGGVGGGSSLWRKSPNETWQTSSRLFVVPDHKDHNEQQQKTNPIASRHRGCKHVLKCEGSPLEKCLQCAKVDIGAGRIQYNYLAELGKAWTEWTVRTMEGNWALPLWFALDPDAASGCRRPKSLTHFLSATLEIRNSSTQNPNEKYIIKLTIKSGIKIIKKKIEENLYCQCFRFDFKSD